VKVLNPVLVQILNESKQSPSNMTDEAFSCSVAVVMHFDGLWCFLCCMTSVSLGTISWINNFTS